MTDEDLTILLLALNQDMDRGEAWDRVKRARVCYGKEAAERRLKAPVSKLDAVRERLR